MLFNNAYQLKLNLNTSKAALEILLGIMLGVLINKIYFAPVSNIFKSLSSS